MRRPTGSAGARMSSAEGTAWSFPEKDLLPFPGACTHAHMRCNRPPPRAVSCRWRRGFGLGCGVAGRLGSCRWWGHWPGRGHAGRAGAAHVPCLCRQGQPPGWSAHLGRGPGARAPGRPTRRSGWRRGAAEHPGRGRGRRRLRTEKGRQAHVPGPAGCQVCPWGAGQGRAGPRRAFPPSRQRRRGAGGRCRRRPGLPGVQRQGKVAPRLIAGAARRRPAFPTGMHRARRCRRAGCGAAAPAGSP